MRQGGGRRRHALGDGERMRGRPFRPVVCVGVANARRAEPVLEMILTFEHSLKANTKNLDNPYASGYI